VKTAKRGCVDENVSLSYAQQGANTQDKKWQIVSENKSFSWYEDSIIMLIPLLLCMTCEKNSLEQKLPFLDSKCTHTQPNTITVIKEVELHTNLLQVLWQAIFQ
jgi:hypothetical protein